MRCLNDIIVVNCVWELGRSSEGLRSCLRCCSGLLSDESLILISSKQVSTRFHIHHLRSELESQKQRLLLRLCSFRPVFACSNKSAQLNPTSYSSSLRSRPVQQHDPRQHLCISLVVSFGSCFSLFHIRSIERYFCPSEQKWDIKYPKFEYFIISDVCISPQAFGTENKAIK